MEQVLMDLMDGNEVLQEIMNVRFSFYYNLHERILREADGLIDFMHVGEDLGNQLTQMINLDIFDTCFAPKYGMYFDMVHSYNARTMMHMCGTVSMFTMLFSLPHLKMILKALLGIVGTNSFFKEAWMYRKRLHLVRSKMLKEKYIGG